MSSKSSNTQHTKNYIKIISLTLSSALILFYQSSFSNDLPNHTKQPSHLFSGIFAGLDFGISEAQSKLQISSYKSPGNGDELPSSFKTKIHDQQYTGEIKLGGGYQLGTYFYAGIYGFLDLNDNHFKSLTDASGVLGNALTTASTVNNNSLQFHRLSGGIAINPGFLLTPQTLLYGVIGWHNATIKVNNQYNVSSSRPFSGNLSQQHNKTINGLRLGVGFLQYIYNNLTLGLNYTLSDFSSFSSKVSGVTTGGGPANIDSSLNNIKIYDQKLQIELDYWLYQHPNRTHSLHLEKSDYNGFFANAKLGVYNPQISGTNSQKLTQDQPIATAISPVSFDIPNDATPVTTSLTFGYGRKLFRHLYVGGEVFVNYTKHLIKTNANTILNAIIVDPNTFSQLTNIKMNNLEPGIDLKLGLLIPHNLLWYLRSGVVINKVNLNVNSRVGFYDRATNFNQIIRSFNTNHNTSVDFTIGTGFEFQFAAHNALSFDYTYTYYGRLNIDKTISTTDLAGDPVSFIDKVKLRVASNTLMMGISHYF